MVRRESGSVAKMVGLVQPHGEPKPARGHGTLYRQNFQFDKLWWGRYYRIKQVTPIVVRESTGLW